MKPIYILLLLSLFVIGCSQKLSVDDLVIGDNQTGVTIIENASENIKTLKDDERKSILRQKQLSDSYELLQPDSLSGGIDTICDIPISNKRFYSEVIYDIPQFGMKLTTLDVEEKDSQNELIYSSFLVYDNGSLAGYKVTTNDSIFAVKKIETIPMNIDNYDNKPVALLDVTESFCSENCEDQGIKKVTQEVYHFNDIWGQYYIETVYGDLFYYQDTFVVNNDCLGKIYEERFEFYEKS